MRTRMRGHMPVVALASISLVMTDLGVAQAQEDGSSFTGDITAVEPVYTARDQIVNAVSGDIEIAAALRDLVEPSLDLSNVGNLSDTDVHDLPVEYQQAFQHLSSVDEHGNDVDLKHPETGKVFSIGAADWSVASVDAGVVKAASDEGVITSVGHITESGKGQVIALAHEPGVGYTVFSYELPVGYQLEPAANGGFTLINEAGEMEGRIDPAWAVDADGNRLATHYELIDGHTLRQHVDTQDAAFPVVMDPSWAWWVATAAACAVSIAPLVATGGAAIASRVPRLISAINKLMKYSKVANAVKKSRRCWKCGSCTC